MGRSQETFSKKEKEKKRLKKRQDKEQKKEDRKLNSDKGKGIDEMLAYVDDEGNITDTPPDPNKKKRVIKQEDIQIGVAKQAEPDPEDLIRKGTVAFFNDSKGYGFIKDHESQESIFVHQNGLVNSIKEGDKVTFEVEPGPKGLNAVRVKLAVKETPAPKNDAGEAKPEQ
jgi:cold shock CspA family protein